MGKTQRVLRRSGLGCIGKNTFFTGTRSRAGGTSRTIWRAMVPHGPNMSQKTDESFGGVDSRHFYMVRRGSNLFLSREYQQENAKCGNFLLKNYTMNNIFHPWNLAFQQAKKPNKQRHKPAASVPVLRTWSVFQDSFSLSFSHFPPVRFM